MERTTRKMPDEQKEKIRQANLGQTRDQATKDKISAANRGKSRTNSQKAAISQGLKDYWRQVPE